MIRLLTHLIGEGGEVMTNTGVGNSEGTSAFANMFGGGTPEPKEDPEKKNISDQVTVIDY